jgi:hypothetical protein
MAKAFVVACKEYFGLKSGQTLMEFKKECDSLTDADKRELAPLLSKVVGEEVAAQTA